MREIIAASSNLTRKIMFFGNDLENTRPYWFSKCGQLKDMVNQLGNQTAFVTLSAADDHWPDLYRLLDPYKIGGINKHAAAKSGRSY